jgi:hypothetical protein
MACSSRSFRACRRTDHHRQAVIVFQSTHNASRLICKQSRRCDLGLSFQRLSDKRMDSHVDGASARMLYGRAALMS